MPDSVRIGTRGSELAQRQTQYIKGLIESRHPGIIIDVQLIKTTGDKILDSPLAKIGDKGIFTKELEAALLDNRIDIAVHSCKDVPTVIDKKLKIAAVIEREDARDVFISRKNSPDQLFSSLPESAVIASGSLRRRCQILSIRQDIQIIDIRGNLSTRLKKLDESNWHGIILAKAGLMRLGIEKRISEILPYEIMLPAAGQGALAVEIRHDDIPMNELVSPFNHVPTELAVISERSLLRELEGGCQIPIGAYGRISGNELTLDAILGSLDGKCIVKGSKSGDQNKAEQIGIELAKDLIQRGGREILDDIRRKWQDENHGSYR